MKILGLPGIKPATEAWLKNLLGSLELGQSGSVVQQYRYWSNPAGGMKMEMEAAAASMAKPDMVVAKSIGTRVALHAITNGLLTANAFVFIGIPLKSYSSEETSALKMLCESRPVLLIQQTHDPLGGYAGLAAVIPGSNTCRKIEIPGNDHQYGNIDQLKEIVENWYLSLGKDNG